MAKLRLQYMPVPFHGRRWRLSGLVANPEKARVIARRLQGFRGTGRVGILLNDDDPTFSEAFIYCDDLQEGVRIAHG